MTIPSESIESCGDYQAFPGNSTSCFPRKIVILFISMFIPKEEAAMSHPVKVVTVEQLKKMLDER